MNRQIDFKVIINGKILDVVYPAMIVYRNGELQYWEEFPHSAVLDAIIIEYTGVYDKDGNKIYSGDILENYNGLRFVVEWGSSTNGEPCWNISKPCNYAKIIGNIHIDKNVRIDI